MKNNPYKMDEEKDNYPGVYLKTPLTIDEVLNTGADFETFEGVDMSGPPPDICDEWDESDLNDFDLNNVMSPLTKPFAAIKEEMQKVNEFIWKRVIKQGNLRRGLMPQNALVKICYHSYWEGSHLPFDSSDLRGHLFDFCTGCGSVITGLEDAVRTMCEGEKSWFIISYKLLFGEMGCPPRVPPKADAFYIIEVKQFKENKTTTDNSFGELQPEEQNVFEKAMGKAIAQHKKGLNFFQHNDYKNAKHCFERAVSVLKYCHLKNEEEEEKHTTFLIKLHTNLAVCYNCTKQPKKACINVNEVRRLSRNRLSCKILFQEGRALFALGSYKNARISLKKALKLEPSNHAIITELTKLNEVESAYKESEKVIWSKALGLHNKIEQPDLATVLQLVPNSGDTEFHYPKRLESQGTNHENLNLKAEIDHEDKSIWRTPVTEHPTSTFVSPFKSNSDAGLQAPLESESKCAKQEDVNSTKEQIEELVESTWSTSQELQHQADEPDDPVRSTHTELQAPLKSKPKYRNQKDRNSNKEEIHDLAESDWGTSHESQTQSDDPVSSPHAKFQVSLKSEPTCTHKKVNSKRAQIEDWVESTWSTSHELKNQAELQAPLKSGPKYRNQKDRHSKKDQKHYIVQSNWRSTHELQNQAVDPVSSTHSKFQVPLKSEPTCTHQDVNSKKAQIEEWAESTWRTSQELQHQGDKPDDPVPSTHTELQIPLKSEPKYRNQKDRNSKKEQKHCLVQPNWRTTHELQNETDDPVSSTHAKFRVPLKSEPTCTHKSVNSNKAQEEELFESTWSMSHELQNQANEPDDPVPSTHTEFQVPLKSEPKYRNQNDRNSKKEQIGDLVESAWSTSNKLQNQGDDNTLHTDARLQTTLEEHENDNLKKEWEELLQDYDNKKMVGPLLVNSSKVDIEMIEEIAVRLNLQLNISLTRQGMFYKICKAK